MTETTQTPPPTAPAVQQGNWWARRSTKAKVAILGTSALIILAGIGSALPAPKPTPSAVVTRTASASPRATAATPPPATATPKATARPTPNATPAATPKPTAQPPVRVVADPHAATPQNIAKSLNDNANFAPSADFSNLKVTVDADTVTLTVKPANEWNEAAMSRHVANDSLVAAKVLLTGYYPSVSQFTLSELADFTDQYGHAGTEAAATMTIDTATAAKYDYNGLKDRVLMAPANMYCVSMSYDISPATWKNLDSGDRGCMTSPQGPA